MSVDINRFRELSRRAQLVLIAGVLTFAGMLPLLVANTAMAAPALTERELQSTSAIPGGATSLTWIFDTTVDTANISTIEIEFCDQPLTLCGAGTENGTDNTTVAADTIPILPAAPTATLSGFTTNTVTSTTRGNGDAGATNNQITITKTTTDAGASLNEASIAIGGFTNDETANKTYYTRMRIYSDAGTTLRWEGVFAQSTSQTLTVSARVQERLDFCVGSTTVNDGTTATPATCAAVTGSTVNLGNVESSNVNVTPVTAANGGDATPTNGIAMVRTNAVNGAVVDYKSVLNTASGKLKVPGATCSGTATTDQCFNSAATTASTLTAGTELFGMTVAGVNCTSTTAYTCSFAAGTYNLVRDVAYDGAAAPNNTFAADTNLVAGTTTNQYAWDDTGAFDRVASSAGSSVKVVDDEALILKFAATSAITTPTGSYTVLADFVATTTF